MSTIKKISRENAWAIPWMRGAVFAVVTWMALGTLPFYPSALRAGLGFACGALGALIPPVGVLALIVLLAPPLTAGNVVVGGLFLLLGLASLQYAGRRGGQVFVVVALAFVFAMFRAEWALAILAGYALGSSEGAAAAFAACVVTEAAGVVLGIPRVGLVATGAGPALVDPARLAALRDPLAFRWLAPAVSSIETGRLMSALTSVRSIPLLVAQPMLWAAAAWVTGTLRAASDPPKKVLRGIGIVSSMTALLAVTSIAAMSILHGPVPPSAMLGGTFLAALIAIAYVAADEWVFTRRVTVSSDQVSLLRTEDADVDELLRVIASAEEALEDRHSIYATVLITDMKGFSKITQEQGTFSTAKLIQKHRDLLLPVIRDFGGRGKSTGGDGLVAAFATADDALAAAALMQRTLKQYNSRKNSAQRVLIRAGLANGDIIVDRTGAPFIGDALNLAARVMSLADGGQVFVARDVIEQAGKLPSPVVSHGEFELKNIARPVNVYEVLWDDGQQPKHPDVEAVA